MTQELQNQSNRDRLLALQPVCHVPESGPDKAENNPAAIELLRVAHVYRDWTLRGTKGYSAD